MEVEKLLTNDPVRHNTKVVFIELKLLSVLVLCVTLSIVILTAP